MMIDTQRKINQEGAMRSICMLSKDALATNIKERVQAGEDLSELPSLILLDYDMDRQDGECLELIRKEKRLAVVPLFFLCDEKNERIEEECYQKGGMVVLTKPLTARSVVRLERAAWQYENTRNYERFLQEQATRLRMAKEIYSLNQKLEQRNDFLHRVFGKYFSDDVLEIILNQPEDRLIGGVRKNLVVLSSDLRGFTSIAEEMESDAMTNMLNEYFGRMTDIITKYHGTVIEFMGDGILAVFGVMEQMNSDLECRKDAIMAAICMQNEMDSMNQFCEGQGYPTLEAGIGIHYGEAFIGNIGSERMMRYNVLGKVVNECSRIESYSVGGQILISRQMTIGLEKELQLKNMIELPAKGIKEPLEIFDLCGLVTEDGTFALLEDERTMLYQIKKEVMFFISRVQNKIRDEQEFAYQPMEISMKEAVLHRDEQDAGLHLYDDIVVRAKMLSGEDLFEQVYAKVVGESKTMIKIHFTHLNQDYKDFVRHELEEE